MSYLGDFKAGSTVNVFFTTNAANGAAVAPSSDFEAADVLLYKDNSATQRSSTAGWTMTSPFDSLTGLHLLSIDLTDDTDAGFYAAGHDYTLVLSPDTETVDSQVVISVIGSFSIENRVLNIGKQSVAGVLPSAAANAAGGLPISAAGGLDLDEMNADIEAIQTAIGTMPTDVFAKVLADVTTDAGARTNAGTMLRALFNRFYDSVTQTSTQQIVHNDAGTVVSTMATSDDGSTATKGKSA